jgi:hypothetical protein
MKEAENCSRDIVLIHVQVEIPSQKASFFLSLAQNGANWQKVGGIFYYL